MTAVHPMTIEADNGDEVLLVCPDASCGRQVVVKRSGGLTVLSRGDFYARHVGGTAALDMSLAATQDVSSNQLN